jgi:hypothetical protein
MVRLVVVALFAIATAISLAGRASATLVLYEPFNYSPGIGLAGQAGQSGSAGVAPPSTPHGLVAPNGNSWMTTNYGAFDPYNATNDALTSATDLTYPNLYHPSATGSVSLGGAGTTPRLAFTSFNNSGDGSPVVAYYSLLVRIDDLSSTSLNGGLIGGFNNTRGSQATNPNTCGASIFAKASGAGFVLGVLEQGIDATQATYDTNVLSLGTTHLVVGKYTINGTLNIGGATPTTDDSVQIWINPTGLGGAEPPGALVAVNQRTDIPTNQSDPGGGVPTVVQTFILRQDGSAGTNAPTSIVIDELRVGSTFADVTPVAIPGDYNGNGSVDAGDYVLWRKGGPLLNQVDDPNNVTPADYTEWRARFGNPGGSGLSLGSLLTVPEPSSAALALWIIAIFGVRRNGWRFLRSTVHFEPSQSQG